MKKKAKLVLIGVTILVLGGTGYYLFPIGYLFYTMGRDMRAGQHCIDSISDKDIPIWVDRTEKYLREYDPNSDGIGDYGMSKPIPTELKELGIGRIDIGQNSVCYV